MTTKADVKRLVRPLLERNDDLVLIERTVIVKPVRHLLRALDICRSSSKDVHLPHWLIVPLFEPKDRLNFNFGGRVYLDGPGLWETGDPDSPELFAKRVETVYLPMLRAVNTIADFREFGMNTRFELFGNLANDPRTHVHVEAALGNLDEAEKICSYFLKTPNRYTSLPSIAPELERITKVLWPLIHTRDRDGLAARLHEWEEQTVRCLKLEELWQPSPFPIETSTSA